MNTQIDNMPTKDEMWDRVKRLGLLNKDGSLDFERLDALGDVPQFELEAKHGNTIL